MTLRLRGRRGGGPPRPTCLRTARSEPSRRSFPFRIRVTRVEPAERVEQVQAPAGQVVVQESGGLPPVHPEFRDCAFDPARLDVAHQKDQHVAADGIRGRGRFDRAPGPVPGRIEASRLERKIRIVPQRPRMDVHLALQPECLTPEQGAESSQQGAGESHELTLSHHVRRSPSVAVSDC